MLRGMSGAQPEAAVGGAPTIDELLLADAPERWSALGFTVLDGCVQLGAVRLRLAGEEAGRGMLGWSLRGISSTELDGLPTTSSQSPPPPAAPAHANGITAIDHVVAMTPALDRSVRSLRAAGLDLRRIREEPTPAGRRARRSSASARRSSRSSRNPRRCSRAGGADRPARLWGLALLAPDLDLTVAALAPHAGEPRAAVQPGRRIATLRRSAGLAVPVALMSPSAGTAA